MVPDGFANFVGSTVVHDVNTVRGKVNMPIEVTMRANSIEHAFAIFRESLDENVKGQVKKMRTQIAEETLKVR